MLGYLGVTKHDVTHLDPDPGLLIKSGKCAIDEEVWTKPFFIHLQVNIFKIQQPVVWLFRYDRYSKDNPPVEL